MTLLATFEPSTPTGADQTPEPHVELEDAIALIRQRYATINQEQAQYRVVERPLVGFSTEGGSLAGYFTGTSLRKMIASYFGESGRADEEYYFWDDRLFFVFRTDYLYDEPFGDVATTMENRFYIENDHMIRWIDAERRHVDPGESGFVEQQAEKLAQSRQLVEILHAPPDN